MFIASATAEWVLVDVWEIIIAMEKRKKMFGAYEEKPNCSQSQDWRGQENIPRAREMKLPHSKEINADT